MLLALMSLIYNPTFFAFEFLPFLINVIWNLTKLV